MAEILEVTLDGIRLHGSGFCLFLFYCRGLNSIHLVRNVSEDFGVVRGLGQRYIISIRNLVLDVSFGLGSSDLFDSLCLGVLDDVGLSFFEHRVRRLDLLQHLVDGALIYVARAIYE